MPDEAAPGVDSPLPIALGRYRALLEVVAPIRVRGRVSQVVGLYVEVEGIPGRLGEMCEIERSGQAPIEAEIVGFREDRTLLMPLGDLRGVQVGASVIARGGLFAVPVGRALLGRVVDGLGRPLDGRGPLAANFRQPMSGAAPHVLERPTIEQPLSTGVRAIDGLLTCGKGQRVGIFAGSGVGKSTVLAMIARHTAADVNVIALIGERGREVREFIDRDLGPEGLARSVVVVSTSEEPALLRMRAAWVATTIAEEFRATGLDVTLLMDSVTRFAMAQREIGLAIGEPPAVKGYTPSVFSQLSRLLERAGTSDSGTITGFYTVLVESDDLTEPVTDAVRGTLDGHIVLTRELATQNHWPAIDVLQSISRVMNSIVPESHRADAARLRELLSTYERSRDLVSIGAYQAGSDPKLDEALRHLPAIERFLRQRPEELEHLDHIVEQLHAAVESFVPPASEQFALDVGSEAAFGGQAPAPAAPVGGLDTGAAVARFVQSSEAVDERPAAG